mgnify:FL=1
MDGKPHPHGDSTAVHTTGSLNTSYSEPMTFYQNGGASMGVRAPGVNSSASLNARSASSSSKKVRQQMDVLSRKKFQDFLNDSAP